MVARGVDERVMDVVEPVRRCSLAMADSGLGEACEVMRECVQVEADVGG